MLDGIFLRWVMCQTAFNDNNCSWTLERLQKFAYDVHSFSQTLEYSGFLITWKCCLFNSLWWMFIWACRKQVQSSDNSRSSYGAYEREVPCPVCRGRGYIPESPEVVKKIQNLVLVERHLFQSLANLRILQESMHSCLQLYAGADSLNCVLNSSSVHCQTAFN